MISNSISVISGRCADNIERLFAVESRLRLKRVPPIAGIEEAFVGAVLSQLHCMFSLSWAEPLLFALRNTLWKCTFYLSHFRMKIYLFAAILLMLAETAVEGDLSKLPSLYVGTVCYRLDFYRKLLSPYVDNQIDKDFLQMSGQSLETGPRSAVDRAPDS